MMLTRICRFSMSSFTHTHAISAFYIRPKKPTSERPAPNMEHKLSIQPLIRSQIDQEADPRLIYHYFSRNAAKGNLKEAMNTIDMLISRKLVSTPKEYAKIMKHLEKYPDRNQEVLTKMLTNHVSPDAFNYSIVMEGYGQKLEYEKMWNTFLQMKEKGIRPDVACYNTLIKWCGKMQYWERMQGNFDGLLQSKLSPTHKTFQNMISAYASAQRLNEMVQTFKKMSQFGLTPDVFIFTTMASALGKAGRLAEMVQLFNQIQQYNVYPTVELYTAMIGAFGKSQQIQTAVQYFKRMLEEGIDPDNFLVDTLCKALGSGRKNLHLLTDVIDFAHQRDVLSRKALSFFVSAISSHGCEIDMNSFQALELKMQVANFKLSPQDNQLISQFINMSKKRFLPPASVAVPEFL